MRRANAERFDPRPARMPSGAGLRDYGRAIRSIRQSRACSIRPLESSHDGPSRGPDGPALLASQRRRLGLNGVDGHLLNLPVLPLGGAATQGIGHAAVAAAGIRGEEKDAPAHPD